MMPETSRVDQSYVCHEQDGKMTQKSPIYLEDKKTALIQE